MYAIVEIAGHQYKVEKDQRIFVNRVEGKEGSKVTFDKILLIDDNGKTIVGAPAIKGAKVSAKIDTHLKGDKVIVFKKKRRKGYKVKNGHRQYLTQLTIGAITKKEDPKAKKEDPKAKKVAPKAKKVAPKAKKVAPKAKKVASKIEKTKT